MNQELIDRANRTLRSEITFRRALRFELDKRGAPVLVDLVEERRTICPVRADTLASLADNKALIDVVRMLWNVSCWEFAAGRRAGVKTERKRSAHSMLAEQLPPHPLLANTI